MRSTTRNRADRGLVPRSRRRKGEGGFTLVEVLVALAIASGALILILSANGASLRKSVNARLSERLERAAESKLSEWMTGAERASGGPLPGFSGHSWEVRTAREDVAPLRKLTRIRFTVTGPGGRVLEWAQLRDTAEGGP